MAVPTCRLLYRREIVTTRDRRMRLVSLFDMMHLCGPAIRYRPLFSRS
jgi:hypothetical protein